MNIIISESIYSCTKSLKKEVNGTGKKKQLMYGYGWGKYEL